MRLYTKVILRRNWTQVSTHDLGEIELDRLPEKIRHLLVNQNLGGDLLLIKVDLMNGRMRARQMREQGEV
jgi:hypothetical protein